MKRNRIPSKSFLVENRNMWCRWFLNYMWSISANYGFSIFLKIALPSKQKQLLPKWYTILEAYYTTIQCIIFLYRNQFCLYFLFSLRIGWRTSDFVDSSGNICRIWHFNECKFYTSWVLEMEEKVARHVRSSTCFPSRVPLSPAASNCHVTANGPTTTPPTRSRESRNFYCCDLNTLRLEGCTLMLKKHFP